MLPCVVTDISAMSIALLQIGITAIIMFIGYLTLAHTLRKDRKEELDKKADKEYVDKMEKDLKEEIATQKETIDCQEETRIRENKEHKDYYEKALQEVHKKLDMILQAVFDGKIKIKN